MEKLEEAIANAEADQLGQILLAVIRRYAEVFPDWDISTIALPKDKARNQIIDNTIAFLKSMKS